MTNTSLDVSDKIDPVIVSILDRLGRIASSLDIPFFVVGATARDVILSHGFGIDTGRATKDMDLGIRISKWNQFSQLLEALVSSGSFVKTRTIHRVLFEGYYPVDIIPFGPIALDKKVVVWPPGNEVSLHVLGFDECLAHAQKIKIRKHPPLRIKFLSIPGMAALKLISWHENYPTRDKDASDLLIIIREYLEAGNLERLYNDHADIMDKDGIDYETAAAFLLGRDVNEILAPDTKKHILDILNFSNKNGDHELLVISMMSHPYPYKDKFKHIAALINAFKNGLKVR